ncbi:MAG: AraC family transcriptional regulator [Oscillospiraceae bacterium]
MYFQKEFQQEELPEKNLTSCFFYNTPDDGSFPLHCHSYYEISFVHKGDRFELVNGEDNHLSDGELVFISPLAFHANRNVCASDILIIQFSPSFLNGNSAFLKAEEILSRPAGRPAAIKASGRTLDVLGELVEYCRAHPNGGSCAAEEFQRNSLILTLLSGLLDSGELVVSSGTGAVTRVSGLDKAINYIIEHPDSRTDMKQAAKIANMSYYAFSRMFKEVVGVNFSDYCNTLRVRLAEELLITTDLPVSEVAARIGIDTQSYFSRLFRQLNGSTPAEYRARNRKR